MGKKHRENDWDDEDRSRKNRQNEVSQEDLSEYIHAGSPGLLVVIFSLLVLLAAVIVWGFVGTLPVTETVTGLVIDTSKYAGMEFELDKGSTKGQAAEEQAAEEQAAADGEGEYLVLCFVDASRFNGQAIKEFGDEAVLKMPDQQTFKGKIEIRHMEPISMERAKRILFDNEWVLERCVKQDYNWLLVIRPTEDFKDYAFTLAEVTLLTEEVPPIQFLMR